MTASTSTRQDTGLKIRHKRQDSIRVHIESLFLAVRGRRDPVTGEWQVFQLMWHLVAAVLSLKGRLDQNEWGRFSHFNILSSPAPQNPSLTPHSQAVQMLA